MVGRVEMTGIICSNSQYLYKGWYFEFHSYCGPWPLKKNGDPKQHAGKKFWEMWHEFAMLTDSERESFKVYQGGCKVF